MILVSRFREEGSKKLTVTWRDIMKSDLRAERKEKVKERQSEGERKYIAEQIKSKICIFLHKDSVHARKREDGKKDIKEMEDGN